jgi:hypothetical protein
VSQDVPSVFEAGETVSNVVLEIDYQIIEHFSRHLYGSANKAIEELVANGFDAYAERVFVYLPGQFTTKYVAVWDDGWSMDIGGLKDLWRIASSPKESLGRVATGPRGTRKMIGKFGIGKLASYAIGNTITHLCRIDDQFLAITVDYRQIHPEDGGQPITTKNPLTAPIKSMTPTQALSFIEEVFDTDQTPLARGLYNESRWTLAVVGDLKGKELQTGRLTWVLGNGMPLRPDFRVWVNDDPVGPRLEKDSVKRWDFSTPALQETLLSDWQKARKASKVAGDLNFGREAGLNEAKPDDEVSYVLLPNLGWVWGEVRLFDRSLLDARASDQGRSHGFFLMVRGRLLNTDDAEVFLKPPSYGTFYRSQFILNIDGIDDELLADRSRLQQDTAKAAELALLQQSVYMAARTFLESRDQEQAEAQMHLAYLPTASREFYREPLTSLLMRMGHSAPMEFHVSKPRVERRLLGDEKPLAALSPVGDGFQVNASHPYYKALEDKLGKSRKAQEFYKIYDLFAVSELLLEGRLYDLGLPDAQVTDVMEWREGLFRELARSYASAPSELAIDLINASYIGGKAFEEALAALLMSMGFKAEPLGASGKEDIFLLATIGPGTYKFIFEAKGSRGKIANDKAEVSGAASHRGAVNAEWAIIVAREFAGFERSSSNEAAIIRECMATANVSIMTVEALILLSEVVSEFGYPLNLIKDVFTAIEPPAEKLQRISKLRSPASDFDYPKLLELIWKAQQQEAMGDAVAYRHIWQTEWKGLMSIEEFEQKLVALETLGGGRIQLKTTPQLIHMVQAPEIIIDSIEASLRGSGSIYREAKSHNDSK